MPKWAAVSSLRRAWATYKYRFVPWIALNLNDKTAVRVSERDNVCQEELAGRLERSLLVLHQYSSLREDLALYDSLHATNQANLLKATGFCVARRQSSIPGAGTGVFIQRGVAKKGKLQRQDSDPLSSIFQFLYFKPKPKLWDAHRLALFGLMPLKKMLSFKVA